MNQFDQIVESNDSSISIKAPNKNQRLKPNNALTAELFKSLK